MINMMPWRETELATRKKMALSIIVAAHMLLIGISSLLLMQGYHRQHELTRVLQRLRSDVQQRQSSFQLSFKALEKQRQLTEISKQVWQRYRFVEKIIHMMMQVSPHFVLIQLSCVVASCDMELGTPTLSTDHMLSAAYQVREVKPGDCPLCYRIHTTVQW